MADWNGKDNKPHYNIQFIAVAVLPYFENKNIFYNFNVLEQNKEYIVLRELTDEEAQLVHEKIVNIGLPDIIIGNAKLIFSFIELENQDNTDYELLNVIKCLRIYKSKKYPVVVPIFAREDIYNQIRNKQIN